MSQSNYPNDFLPQIPGSSPPNSEIHGIACPPDLSTKFVLLQDKSLCVVKGRDTLANINLKNFFQNVSEGYSEENFLLKKGGITLPLNYGNIGGDDEEISFICIFPQYFRTKLKLQSTWEIEWRFTGEATFRKLGRILVLSGTENGYIPIIELRNNQAEDIPITMLISK